MGRAAVLHYINPTLRRRQRENGNPHLDISQKFVGSAFLEGLVRQVYVLIKHQGLWQWPEGDELGAACHWAEAMDRLVEVKDWVGDLLWRTLHTADGDSRW